MARRKEFSARFRHSPELVYAALSDRRHWEARITEMRKYSENRLEEFTVGESGVELVLHHVLPLSALPDIAKTVMRSDLIITRRESYSPFDTQATGHYEATIPGGPGSLTGTMTLFASDGGAVLRTASEAKVNLPFVGGKLEELMLDNLVDVFTAEAAITAGWLDRG
ncbi:DUF2505 domain-containing protein [Rhodococcus yananensis]|uniref:DUF2505 domain-containing protein n=1 Tax=Rhodococcus yananensis TaxID=2879464 RepID=UPI003EBF2FA0